MRHLLTENKPNKNARYFNQSFWRDIPPLGGFLSAVTLAVFILIYLETILFIITGWFSYNGGHGLIIFGISIYIIWTRRLLLLKHNVIPSLLWGVSITTAGSLLFLIGHSAAILLLQQVSLIVTLLGLILLLLGPAYLKILFLPISYLIFMFPLFEEILGIFSIHFQIMTSYIASSILKVIGMPVHFNRQFVFLPHISLEVAKVCSGINNITALISLTIPLSYLTRKTLPGMIVLVLITFLAGILSNGLRVALIGIWTQYSDISSVHGPFNLLYASSVFLAVFFIVILYATITGKENVKQTLQQSSHLSIDTKLTKNTAFSNYFAINVAIITLSITLVLFYYLTPTPVKLKHSFNKIPMQIDSYFGENVESLNERFENPSPDHILRRIYKDSSGNTIKVFVGFFSIQTQDKEIVSYHFDWLHNRASLFSVPSTSKNITINKTQYYDRGVLKSAFFWYDINHKILENRIKAKFHTFLKLFSERRNDGAIVIIAVEKGRLSESDEFSKNAINFISSFLPLLHDILSDTIIIGDK